MKLKKFIIFSFISTIIAILFVQLIEIEKVSGYIGYLLGVFSSILIISVWNLIGDIFDGE
jgi:hypothetical protein